MASALHAEAMTWDLSNASRRRKSFHAHSVRKAWTRGALLLADVPLEQLSAEIARYRLASAHPTQPSIYYRYS